MDMNGQSFISGLTKEKQMKQDFISVDRLAFFKNRTTFRGVWDLFAASLSKPTIYQ
jgi:hypothetical protein